MSPQCVDVLSSFHIGDEETSFVPHGVQNALDILGEGFLGGVLEHQRY